MSVTVYGLVASPFVRAVRVALIEKGVGYEFEDIGPMALKAPANLARHPFGRVPSLRHDDLVLYETQAILRYVDAAFDGPALQPREPRQAARMNQVMGVLDCYTFPEVGRTIGFNRVVAPLFGLPSDEAVVAAAVPAAELCLGELARLLGDNPFFAGAALCLADIMVAPHMKFFAVAPETRAILERNPALLGWLERMEARPSMTETRPPF